MACSCEGVHSFNSCSELATRISISDKDGMAETDSYLKSGLSVIGFIASLCMGVTVEGGRAQGKVHQNLHILFLFVICRRE